MPRPRELQSEFPEVMDLLDPHRLQTQEVSGDAFRQLCAQIAATPGARIERMEVGKSNSHWKVSYRVVGYLENL